MDSLDLFRPLFAYVAHLAAVAVTQNAPVIDARAVKGDLSLLIGEATRFRGEELDPNFDQAWFALSVWIGGALRRLRGCEGIAGELEPLSPGENREEDFFRRLDLLLKPISGSYDKGYPGEILSILKVYRTCLDLGALAFGDDPESASRIGKCRERCGRAIASRVSPVCEKTVALAGLSLRGVAAAAAVWVAAAAVPAALYGLYAFLLGNLYAAVAG